MLDKGHARPDLMIAAGFSYQVVTAHNGCLQMEVTVHGKMAHAAIPDTGVDALQAAVHILNSLYAQNKLYKQISSKVEGINHPYLNVGRIEGGTNTNVVPGTVSFKLDRRMIPEENPEQVEANIRQVIAEAVKDFNQGRPSDALVSIDIKRLLMAHAIKPLAGHAPLGTAITKQGGEGVGVHHPGRPF